MRKLLPVVRGSTRYRYIQIRQAEATANDLKIGTLYKAAGSEFPKKGAPIWLALEISQNAVISQNPDASGSVRLPATEQLKMPRSRTLRQ